MDQRAIELVREFLEGLLARAGEPGRVEASWEAQGVYANLVGNFHRIPDDDRFRGDLARLARLHLRANGVKEVPVVVDVNGRWALHLRELTELARRAAQRALEERRRVKLDPMPPDDRRIVHLALADFPGVKTYSVGKGAGRRVVIEPTP